MNKVVKLSVFYIELKFSTQVGMLTWIASLFLISSVYLIYRATDRQSNKYS